MYVFWKRNILGTEEQTTVYARHHWLLSFLVFLVWNCKHAHFSSLILPVLKIVIVNIFGKHQ